MTSDLWEVREKGESIVNYRLSTHRPDLTSELNEFCKGRYIALGFSCHCSYSFQHPHILSFLFTSTVGQAFQNSGFCVLLHL